MKAHHSILFLSLFSLGAFSATITLYEVAVPTPTATDIFPSFSQGISFTISPVGVGEDGKTTYIEEGVRTKLVAIFSDTTSTFSSPSTTYKNTFEQDATGLLRQDSITDSLASINPVGRAIQSCNFQGTTAGSCVRSIKFPGIASTFITTYSGTLIPVFTLTETSNIPVQTENSRALARSDIWNTYQLLGLVLSLSFMLDFWP